MRYYYKYSEYYIKYNTTAGVLFSSPAALLWAKKAPDCMGARGNILKMTATTMLLFSKHF